MAYNDHPDDQPSEWRRITTDEETRAAMPEHTLQDPVAVGQMFCIALDDHEEFHDVLLRFITPDSIEDWGDFSEAAACLGSIEDRGYGSIANRALGNDNVAYFKILSGVTDSYQVLDEQLVLVAAVLTLAWRPDYGEWRVHSIGDPLPPESVPH